MPSPYRHVVRPTSSWFKLNLTELVQHRDLLLLLIHRDFVSKYKQTVLGPAWFVLQPLLTTIVFTVIFGKIAKMPTDKLPAMLFYLCGMLAWSYFAQCVQGTSTTFVSNANLFDKVYFPRLVVPLSVVISNLLAFAIQFAMFLCFWLYFKIFTPAGAEIHMRPLAFLLPLFLLQTVCIGLGVGLWMSALTAKYRDFVHLMGFLTQLWLYATPVVYPMAMIPERWRWISLMNPMSAVVEVYRYALLGAGTVRVLYVGTSVAITGLLLLSGIVMFSKVERTFIDTV